MSGFGPSRHFVVAHEGGRERSEADIVRAGPHRAGRLAVRRLTVSRLIEAERRAPKPFRPMVIVHNITYPKSSRATDLRPTGSHERVRRGSAAAFSDAAKACKHCGGLRRAAAGRRRAEL